MLLWIAQWPGGLAARAEHSPTVWLPERSAAGDRLLRVQCRPPYTATVYAEGLSSPDGLAFSPSGELYVAEETAGRVSRIASNGLNMPVLSGLSNPEGIAFDSAGNLYVVEDVAAGRLLRRTPAGVTSTLASGLDAPEGVVWTSNDELYVTESNAEFVSSPVDLRTRVSAVSAAGIVTPILTNTPTVSGSGPTYTVTFWSYSGIVEGPSGSLYVANELSGQSITQTAGSNTFVLTTTDSIFAVDPASGARIPIAAGLSRVEGLRFSANRSFPLYVAEEDTGSGTGRLSRVESNGAHAPFCVGFERIEDVVVGPSGRLYVSEDSSGMIIRIEPVRDLFLPALRR